jgi:hypothetical protein
LAVGGARPVRAAAGCVPRLERYLKALLSAGKHRAAARSFVKLQSASGGSYSLRGSREPVNFAGLQSRNAGSAKT